jgi:hypothetical protein
VTPGGGLSAGVKVEAGEIDVKAGAGGMTEVRLIKVFYTCSIREKAGRT